MGAGKIKGDNWVERSLVEGLFHRSMIHESLTFSYVYNRV